MNEADAIGAGPVTAGALLRAARERQGLHIAALAASIKVTPRKLDALEHDRYDELPDATFTRALAQTVCRALKIDAQPVLALLPQAGNASLEPVGGRLNTPYRERPGRESPGGLAVAAIRPMAWAGAALMVAALAVYFLPSGLWEGAVLPAVTAAPPAAMPASAAEPVTAAAPPPASAASDVMVASLPAVAASGSALPAVVETVHSAPPPEAAASAAVAEPVTLVQLRTEESSWIEVRDARGQILLSRTVQPGERVGFDGELPFKLTIGNAPATRLSFRGKPVDLSAARDGVARLELQ